MKSKLKRFCGSVVVSASFLLLTSLSLDSAAMQLGQNFWFMADWSPNFIMKDLTLCNSRTFYTLAVGDDRDYPHAEDPDKTIIYASGLELDADGYPMELPSNGIRAVVKLYLTGFSSRGVTIPTGTYTLIFEGTGEVRVRLGRFETDMVFTGTGGTTRKTFELTKLNPSGGTGEGYLNLRITRSERSDHIRRIRLIQPDENGGTSWADNYESQPWSPLFLQDVRPYSVMRWMEANHVNTTKISDWSKRSTQFGEDQGEEGGFAYEWQVDLANRMKNDVWICCPMLANDNYMDELASLVHEQLDPGRKVYIEYGNEIWLGKGGLMGTGSWEPTVQMQADRSARLYKAFEDAFGTEKDRVINVMSGQAASTGVVAGALSRLEGNAYGVHAEAVAIAPYLYGINAATLRSGIGTSIGYVSAHKAIADQYNCDLICYEGGQHIISGNMGAETNFGPDIYSIYTDYLAGLEPYVSVFVHFAIYGTCANDGCWGSSLYPGQSLDQAPKAKALWDYSASKGQIRDIPTVAVDQAAPAIVKGAANRKVSISVDNGIVKFSGVSSNQTVSLFDMTGKCLFSAQSSSSMPLQTSAARGMYLAKVAGNGNTVSHTFVVR